MPTLKPGDKAPDFTVLDQDGDKVKLSSFEGRKVLVYFYPSTLTWCPQRSRGRAHVRCSSRRSSG